MKQTIYCMMAAGMLLSVPACTTTGDPTQGGIFWSERKAEERLAQCEETLDEIESDTSRVERRNRHLRTKIKQHQ